MTATTRRILRVLLLAVVSTIVPLTNAHPNYYLRTSNEDYPSTKTNKTRRMIAVGSLGDDLAKVFHTGTGTLKVCTNDEGCPTYVPILITLIIMMVCVCGHWCYKNGRNDGRVAAQKEQNSI